MAGYPCCCSVRACFPVCVSTQSNTLQLTVGTDVFSAGSSAYPCEETECDERTGEWLLTKVATGDLATEWASQSSTYNPDEPTSCCWIGEEFETCAYDYDQAVGEPPPPPDIVTQLITLRWQYQSYLIVPGTPDLYHCAVILRTLSGTPIFYYIWQDTDVAGDRACDPLELPDASDIQSESDRGCEMNTASIVTVELPP